MNNLDKKFTLLSACYNGEQYLGDWLSSIIAQTYRPLEVIFIDDQSDDGSWSKVRGMRKRAKKAGIELHMIRHKKKLYYGGALRFAAAAGSGDYFGTFDVDDMLKPYAVEHVMNLYKENPEVGHIYTNFQVCACDMTPIKRGFSRQPDKKNTIMSMGLKGVHVYSHFRTFSRSIEHFDEVVFPKAGKYAVDQYMGMSLEERTVGMFTNRLCYLYRSGCKDTISALFGRQRREYWKKLVAHFDFKRTEDEISAFPIKSEGKIWTD